MARQRMYRRGRKLSLLGLIERAMLRREYVFMFDRPCHPSWVISMQLNTLANLCRHGGFRAAVRNERTS